MKEFISGAAVFVGTLIALTFPRILPLAGAQEVPQKNQPSQQGDNISDKELRTFAKAYVELQKIQREYEPSLRDTQEPERAQKVQQEAMARVENSLKGHGFTPESFQRTFALVNANDELRKKALGLIEEERDKERKKS